MELEVKNYFPVFSLICIYSRIFLSFLHFLHFLAYLQLIIIAMYAGLLLWNQMRRQWVGNRRHENKKQVGEPIIR